MKRQDCEAHENLLSSSLRLDPSNLLFPVPSDMIPSDGLDKRIPPAALRRNQDQDLATISASHAKNATEQKVHSISSVSVTFGIGARKFSGAPRSAHRVNET
jgi:hypothetical protein